MRLNFAILAVLLVYLLLGTVNSLAATTMTRRVELAMLRSVGATDAQVRSTVRREAFAMAALAGGAGVVLSLFPIVLLGLGFLGRPWPGGPWWLIPATVCVVTAVAFMTVEIPVRGMLAPRRAGIRRSVVEKVR